MCGRKGLEVFTVLVDQRSRRRSLVVALVHSAEVPHTVCSYPRTVTGAHYDFICLCLVVTAVSVALVACCPVALLRKAKQGSGKRQEIETMSQTLCSLPWFGEEYPLVISFVPYARNRLMGPDTHTSSWSLPSVTGPVKWVRHGDVVGVREAFPGRPFGQRVRIHYRVS